MTERWVPFVGTVTVRDDPERSMSAAIHNATEYAGRLERGFQLGPPRRIGRARRYPLPRVWLRVAIFIGAYIIFACALAVLTR